jgi:hypothetical protein
MINSKMFGRNDGNCSPAYRHELVAKQGRPSIVAALLFVDYAGREVGVDRHLLARHGVEVEAGGDFHDAA